MAAPATRSSTAPWTPAIAHDALAHLVPAGLELRLDQRQQAVRVREHAHERRQHERQGDERDVDDGEGSRGPGQVAGSQETGVDALQDGHALVGPQPLVQLPAADVERGHVRRAGLQQAVGEAAGRGADVEAARAPRRRSPKAASAVASLSPPRETNAGPWSTSSSALSRDRRPRLRDDAAVDAHAPGHHERLGAAAGLGEPALVEQLIESRHGVIVGHGCPVRRAPTALEPRAFARCTFVRATGLGCAPATIGAPIGTAHACGQLHGVCPTCSRRASAVAGRDEAHERVERRVRRARQLGASSARAGALALAARSCAPVQAELARERAAAAAGVRAGLLAERLVAAGLVEDVVDDLEQQAELGAERARRRRRRPRRRRPRSPRTRPRRRAARRS